MTLEMEIKNLPSQPVIRVQARVEPQRLEKFLVEAYSRIFPYLESLGEYPAGPPFVVYYDSVGHGEIDLDICVPTSVVLEVPCEERYLMPDEVPGGEFAATVHVGSRESIGEAYRALFKWFTTRGYLPFGPCREVRLASLGGTGEPLEEVTEILFPVDRAA